MSDRHHPEQKEVNKILRVITLFCKKNVATFVAIFALDFPFGLPYKGKGFSVVGALGFEPRLAGL